jgi:hypothetical protein
MLRFWIPHFGNKICWVILVFTLLQILNAYAHNMDHFQTLCMHFYIFLSFSSRSYLKTLTTLGLGLKYTYINVLNDGAFLFCLTIFTVHM